jgi:hypothetical protein
MKDAARFISPLPTPLRFRHWLPMCKGSPHGDIGERQDAAAIGGVDQASHRRLPVLGMCFLRRQRGSSAEILLARSATRWLRV